MRDALSGLAMRTTLTLDDDILVAAKALAERRHRTLGEIVSELARQSLTHQSLTRGAPSAERNGVPLLQAESPTQVTLDLVNRLRDEAP